jgi:hypothetical protein
LHINYFHDRASGVEGFSAERPGPVVLLIRRSMDARCPPDAPSCVDRKNPASARTRGLGISACTGTAMIRIRVRLLRPFVVTPFLALVCANAIAGTDSAKGTLTVQGEEKPLSLPLTHTYYVIGPDTFDAKRTTPRLILTGEDVTEKIAECADISCATYAATDGINLDLDPGAPISFWAHVRPMQYAGVIDTSLLAFSIRSPDHIAGTLRYRSNGVEVDVTFDATLLKTFPAVGK